MSSTVAIPGRVAVPAPEVAQAQERKVHRRVAVAWALLVVNTLTFYKQTWSGEPLIVPIPSVVGKIVTQGALPAALLLALTVNRRMVIRPSAFLCILSLLAVEAFMVALEPGHIGTPYRTLRMAGFVATLWMLSPWWGRRDMLLVRCHLVTMTVVIGIVLVGIPLAPKTAIAQGRLEGAFWPFPPTQVAHFAAIAIGLITLLWMSGIMSGRIALVAAVVGIPVLLLTHTRTALVAMIASILIGGLSLIRAKARVRKLFAIAGAAMFVGTVTLSGVITTWLARGQDTQQLTSLTGRATVWSAIIATPRNEFQTIFGFGLSNLSFNGLSIDSNWLGAFLDLGLLGIALDVAMLIFVLVAAYFQPSGARRALALFLVTYCLISSFTEVGLSAPSLYLLELTLAASLVVPGAADRKSG